MKYLFMETNKNRFEINIMARVFNVTTKAFWMWKGRGLSQRKQEDAVLLEEIKIIHAKSDRAYGSPRIKDELNDVKGKQVSRARGNRLRVSGTDTTYYTNSDYYATTSIKPQQKRYDADMRVAEYDMEPLSSGSINYLFCGNLPATYSRDHIKFRYDAFGNQILALHATKVESDEASSRIGVKTKSYSTVSADNNVQLIAKHDTNVGIEFSAGFFCWGSTIVNIDILNLNKTELLS